MQHEYFNDTFAEYLPECTYFASCLCRADELNQHFKTLAKQYHPDINATVSASIMQDINAQYKQCSQFLADATAESNGTLSAKQRRQQYRADARKRADQRKQEQQAQEQTQAKQQAKQRKKTMDATDNQPKQKFTEKIKNTVKNTIKAQRKPRKQRKPPQYPDLNKKAVDEVKIAAVEHLTPLAHSIADTFINYASGYVRRKLFEEKQ